MSRSRRRATCSVDLVLGEKHQVWMSHGDRHYKMRRVTVAGVSPNAPFAGDPGREAKVYGLMFHPEVGAHARRQLIRNLSARSPGLTGDWTMRAFPREAIEKSARR